MLQTHILSAGLHQTTVIMSRCGSYDTSQAMQLCLQVPQGKDKEHTLRASNSV